MNTKIVDIVRDVLIPNLKKKGIVAEISKNSNLISIASPESLKEARSTHGNIGYAVIFQQPFGNQNILYVFYRSLFSEGAGNKLVGELIAATILESGLWLDWNGNENAVIKVIPKGRLRFKGRQTVPGFKPLLLWNIESDYHSANFSTRSWNGLFDVYLLRRLPIEEGFHEYIIKRGKAHV